MKTLRIYGPHTTALPFDLRDFLELLAPRSMAASWTVSAVDAGYEWFDATGPGGARLAAMLGSSEPISGTSLAEAARDTTQVIWGEFSATLPEMPGRDWIVIRAIDSSFYEITADEDVLRLIESSFDDVRVQEDRWKPVQA